MFLPSLLGISISHFSVGYTRTQMQEASFSCRVTRTAYVECQRVGNQLFSWERMGCRPTPRDPILLLCSVLHCSHSRCKIRERVLKVILPISLLGQESEVKCSVTRQRGSRARMRNQHFWVLVCFSPTTWFLPVKNKKLSLLKED